MADQEAAFVIPSVNQFIQIMFEIFSEIMGKLLKRNGKYQIKDYAAVMLVMMGFQASAETVSRIPGMPSADRIFALLGQLNSTAWTEIINLILRKLILKIQLPKDAKISVAVDLTDKPFYGKTSYPFVCGYKPKKGTSYSLLYLMLSIELNGYRLPLAFYPITQLDRPQITDYILEALDWLSQYYTIAVVLFDRGLLSKERLIALSNAGYKVIVPLCLTEKVKQAVLGMSKKQKRKIAKKGLIVKRLSGVKPVADDFHYVILPKREHQQKRKKSKKRRFPYIVFITNTDWSPRTVARYYRLRWGIETKFRLIKQLLPYTSSRKHNIRVALWGFATLWYACWIVLNVKLAEQNPTMRRKRKERQAPIAITRFRITIPLSHLQIYVVSLILLNRAKSS